MVQLSEPCPSPDINGSAIVANTQRSQPSEVVMKITKVETFLVRWGDVDRLSSEAAFGAATAVVAIHADGMVGYGEASPMQGGVASLAVIARDMTPALVGADVLDHAVLCD